jgi:hypothetical protein
VNKRQPCAPHFKPPLLNNSVCDVKKSNPIIQLHHKAVDVQYHEARSQ